MKIAAEESYETSAVFLSDSSLQKNGKSPVEVLKYSTFFDIMILIRPTIRLKRNLSL